MITEIIEAVIVGAASRLLDTYHDDECVCPLCRAACRVFYAWETA